MASVPLYSKLIQDIKYNLNIYSLLSILLLSPEKSLFVL